MTNTSMPARVSHTGRSSRQARIALPALLAAAALIAWPLAFAAAPNSHAPSSGVTNKPVAGRAVEALEVCLAVASPSSEQIYQPLRPPILTAADVLSAKANTRRDWMLLGGGHTEVEILLTLTMTGAARLAEVTSASVGRTFMILVNGHAIQNGVLMGPLADTALSIKGAFDLQTAQAMVDEINSQRAR